MPALDDQGMQLAVFVAIFGLVTIMGFSAAKWRRPNDIHRPRIRHEGGQMGAEGSVAVRVAAAQQHAHAPAGHILTS